MQFAGIAFLCIFAAICAYSFIVNLIRWRVNDLAILVMALLFFLVVYSHS